MTDKKTEQSEKKKALIALSKIAKTIQEMEGSIKDQIGRIQEKNEKVTR